MISELAELEFESFVDSADGFEAYIPEAKDAPEIVNALLNEYSGLGAIHYTTQRIEGQNWNARWEADYPLVKVGEWCAVRAPFHPRQTDVKLDILVSPKMSFGTGHHATTWLMLSFLLQIDLRQKRVLDMGCGTGVLAIAAALSGASEVLGIDIEEVAVQNTIENASLNNVQFAVEKGGAEAIGGGLYDVILANINKNVLMADMDAYKSALDRGGILLLSGFFSSDTSDLKAAAFDRGLVFEEMETRDGWAALKFSNPHKS